jgi:Zn-dependent peptidase ImmA (M78 family)
VSTMNEPSTLSNSAIGDYAEKVGEHFNIYDGAGAADLKRLVAVLGGRIEYAETNESLHVNERGNFTIFLPPFTSGRRDRFTIAHELGHYYLHYLHQNKSGAEGYFRGERNSVETQANVFASALLMPAAAFKKAYLRFAGDAWALAGLFDVSPDAARVRAQVLGLR